MLSDVTLTHISPEALRNWSTLVCVCVVRRFEEVHTHVVIDMI